MTFRVLIRGGFGAWLDADNRRVYSSDVIVDGGRVSTVSCIKGAWGGPRLERSGSNVSHC